MRRRWGVDNGEENAFPLEGVSDGLTKREYFAGLAMQGLLSGDISQIRNMDTEQITRRSVAFADSLLFSLEGKK